MTPQFKNKSGGRGIQWCDYTWNPVGGCKHQCRWTMPDGATAVCYAETVAEQGTARAGYPNGFASHYWRPHLLNGPAKVKEPSFIFLDSMSDLMGHWVPEEQVTAVLDVVRDNPLHVFQLLTKAPGRLSKFMARFPPNLWVGVSSAPDFMMGKPMPHHAQVKFLEKTLEVLGEVKKHVPVVWMSVEPLSWDIAPYMKDHPLEWAVIGAATNGPKKFQPDPTHVQALLEVFDGTATPVFFKGNLHWSPFREDFPVGNLPAPSVLRRQQLAKQFEWPLNAFLPRKEGVDAHNVPPKQRIEKRGSPGFVNQMSLF